MLSGRFKRWRRRILKLLGFCGPQRLKNSEIVSKYEVGDLVEINQYGKLYWYVPLKDTMICVIVAKFDPPEYDKYCLYDLLYPNGLIKKVPEYFIEGYEK